MELCLPGSGGGVASRDAMSELTEASGNARWLLSRCFRCIAAGCKPGGTVLDPFAGSGTTGLAAIQLGRRFTGIDISPDFAHLAAGRLARAVAGRQEGTR